MADMEQFSEEHSKLMLDKEWLVKIDSLKSIPYLIKFYHSPVDLSSCVLLTDTKSVWAEVLSSRQFARRWRACNLNAPSALENAEEDKWRTKGLEFLSQAHTLGGIADLSFELVDTNYADMAFELERDRFKWRWEVNYLGRTVSAEIISKHLILPLISMTHLSFSMPEAIRENSDADLDKVIDKTGRTARRTTDIHIKNALSKPRVATALRRMTAMLNFLPELPATASDPDGPNLDALLESVHSQQPPMQTLSTHPPRKPNSKPPSSSADNDIPLPSKKHAITDDSATEPDSDGDVDARKPYTERSLSPIPPPDVTPPIRSVSPAPRKLKTSSQVNTTSDSESSPERPPKKAKKPRLSSSSDGGSEEDRRRHITKLKGGSSTTAKRGTRQPIKRGGKRF